jgi:hypothetical protein
LKNGVTKDGYISPGDPLSILRVIDRLEVGPIRLEPRRLRVPYVVSQNGQVDSLELVYRFEEDVFLTEESASLNLGSMLSVQVALNYGPFCDEIVLHGWFDSYDRRFIEEMSRNTAREIFVKKFLHQTRKLPSSPPDLR